jgi:hypothetical protein
MDSVEQLISDQTIDVVFAHSDFGSVSKRDVIRYALLKCACGIYTCHTAKVILHELGLVNIMKYKLTKSGKEYLFYAFYDGHSI